MNLVDFERTALHEVQLKVQQLTRRLRDLKVRYPCTEITLVDQFDDLAAGIEMVNTSGAYWLHDIWTCLII